MIHVTQHAIERFIERVARVSPDQARDMINTPTVRMAAMFGCGEVILGSGHRIVLQGHTVVTVRPKCGPPKRRYIRQIEE